MLKLRQPTHATKRKVKSKMQAFKRTNKRWQKAKQIHICLSCAFFGVISHGSPACYSDTKAMWIWHFVSSNVVAGAISSGQWISASSSLSITLFNSERHSNTANDGMKWHEDIHTVAWTQHSEGKKTHTHTHKNTRFSEASCLGLGLHSKNDNRPTRKLSYFRKLFLYAFWKVQVYH